MRRNNRKTYLRRLSSQTTTSNSGDDRQRRPSNRNLRILADAFQGISAPPNDQISEDCFPESQEISETDQLPVNEEMEKICPSPHCDQSREIMCAEKPQISSEILTNVIEMSPGSIDEHNVLALNEEMEKTCTDLQCDHLSEMSCVETPQMLSVMEICRDSPNEQFSESSRPDLPQIYSENVSPVGSPVNVILVSSETPVQETYSLILDEMTGEFISKEVIASPVSSCDEWRSENSNKPRNFSASPVSIWDEWPSDDSYKPSDLSESSGNCSDSSDDNIIEHDVASNINVSETEAINTPSTSRAIQSEEADGSKEKTNSNKEVKKKRNKHAKPEQWKANIAKSLRQSGKSYFNRKGRRVESKCPKPVDCTNCRYKCQENFPEDARMGICKEYYEIGNSAQQKIFLSTLIKEMPVARRYLAAKTNKKSSRVYFLPGSGGQRMRVCLKFFCATFSISHRVIEVLMKNVSALGLYTGKDGKIGKTPANATSDEQLVNIKNHIDTFPRVESHYCRRDSKKHYLSSDLNVPKMYELYKLYCTDKNIVPASLYVYRKVFKSYDPELSFYVPKKDQCFVCNAYKNSNDKENLEETYQQHKEREKLSMDKKKAESVKAKEEKGETFRAITFDLQSILSVPFAGDNQIYYKRKLNVYNFTIFENHSKNGFCYVWDEVNGNKGSNEIATGLLLYLFQLPPTVTHVSSFSDTAAGQNRNQNVCAAMLYAVTHIDHLQIIDLNYMESGHSYLEADSMHATIERARKHKRIYTTREWALLISVARINPCPYFVNILKHEDFYDVKNLAANMIHNTKLNVENSKVNWLKIKQLRFEKCKPYKIQYKYNLSSDVFYEIQINKKRGKETKKWEEIELRKAYAKPLMISDMKKKDLLDLVEKKIIPGDYKYFFDSLPSTSKPKRTDSDYES